MRVIAGAARGRRLRGVEGRKIRPTSDRVREALFSILGDRVAGRRFLDLCAGTGAVGIEALSRGAVEATFVERDRRAVVALRDNLDRCGLADRARVVVGDVLEALDRGALADRTFEVVFLDPPYGSPEAAAALQRLVAAQAGIGWEILILEHSRRDGPPGGSEGPRPERTAVYGDTALSFYRRPGDPGAGGGAV